MKKEYNETIVGSLDRQEEMMSIQANRKTALYCQLFIVVYQEMMNFKEKVIPLQIKRRF